MVQCLLLEEAALLTIYQATFSSGMTLSLTLVVETNTLLLFAVSGQVKVKMLLLFDDRLVKNLINE